MIGTCLLVVSLCFFAAVAYYAYSTRDPNKVDAAGDGGWDGLSGRHGTVAICGIIIARPSDLSVAIVPCSPRADVEVQPDSQQWVQQLSGLTHGLHSERLQF